MKPSLLRFGNFLAPSMMPVYTAIAHRIGQKLSCPIQIETGTCYNNAYRDFDVHFICGLAYIELANGNRPKLEPIAAPVLQGRRYQGQPIYFSDVVVHKNSPFRSFRDLQGRSWCYNEPFSQSGYGITRYWLASMGETASFFGQVVQSGWHAQSLDWIREGRIDASAIDSHILELSLRTDPGLASQIRIIDTLGPSTIQPVTVASHLPSGLKEQIQQCFVDLASDPQARPYLDQGLIKRFVPMSDQDYNDLRSMQSVCTKAKVLKLEQCH